MAFLKPLLTVSVWGITSIVASNAAYAMDQSSTFCKPGFYAGVQGGRSDTFYSGKTLIQAAAPTHNQQVTSGSVATQIVTTDTSTNLSGQHVDDIGIGGRIYAGYQFNPYFALETGYTQYAKTTFRANGLETSNENITNTNLYNGVTVLTEKIDETWSRHYNGEITENAIDLVGKVTMPLYYGFGLYAKAGAAYISSSRHVNSILYAHTKTDQNFIDDTTTKTTSNGKTSATEFTKSYQAFRPVAGVGVNYTLPNSNISVDASYSRVFSSGVIPQASLAALGLEYKFA